MPCLDTVALIDLMRGGDRETSRRAIELVNAETHAGRQVTTTRFNVAELYFGVEKAVNPVKQAERIEQILRRTVILEFDDQAARRFAQIKAHLSRQGRLSGDMDALIGAVALTHGQALVTRNVVHFEPMPGLTVLTY